MRCLDYFGPHLLRRWALTLTLILVTLGGGGVCEARAIQAEGWAVADGRSVVDSRVLRPAAPQPIRPGDRLIIAIPGLRVPGCCGWGESIVRVGADGKIRLAVVGAVQAVDLLPVALASAICGRLEADGILRDAQVSVTVLPPKKFAPQTNGSAR